MLYMGVTGSISISPNGVDVVWTIANFLALSKEDSAFYYSPHFFFSNERWSFEIYPNGCSDRDSYGHVNVTLFKCSSIPSISEVFSLSLRTANGGKVREKYGTKVFKLAEYHDFLRFIPRLELLRRRSELLPDGVLTVVCTLKNTTSAGSARKDLQKNSKNTCVESCTQTEEEIAENICVIASTQTVEENGGEDIEQNSKITYVEACTQTEEETTAENSESICVVASTQTGKENAPANPMRLQPQMNSGMCLKLDSLDLRTVLRPLSCIRFKRWTILESKSRTFNADERFKEESRKACVDAFTQTEEQNVSPINLPEKQNLVTDVSDFLKGGRGVDVTFELETASGKTELIAHQLILALRSPYFADNFYGKGLNKRHLIVPLKGIDPKAFKQMIRYCYDYKPSLRTTEDACVLFKVASEFKVFSLQTLCRTFIRKAKIDPSNVFIALEVSEQMEDKSFGDMCYKILQEKTRDVIANYELCDVTSAMVHTILSLAKLSLNSEYELIKWICDWAKVKSEDEHSSSENARGCLGRFLKDMNFLVLTMGEFATLCKDNPGLFSSDEIISIYQNIACPGTREMPDWYDNDVKFRVYTGLNE